MLRIEHIGPLPREAWDTLIADEPDPFGMGDDPTEWRRKDHFTVLYDGDRPVAATGLLVARTNHGAVVGVGGVIVNRDYRDQGHLRPVFDAALERAATLGPDTAMLFCAEWNVSLYAHFGFLEITAPVIVDQPGGAIEMADHSMWRPLREGATWPEGPVRLRGLPF
jgi:predicted GNAT family N-acyltransferase